jgi:exodeoxyribonuclease X
VAFRLRVVDFETTGIAPPAVVIEVGVCDLVLGEDGFAVQEPKACLYGGVTRIPPAARAVNHIAPEEIAELEPFHPDLFIQAAKLDGIDALAAHGADFEDGWLGPWNDLPWICTYKAALRVWPDAPGHSNQSLRYWLQDQGLSKIDDRLATPAHRAGPDAYATAHLLRAILWEATLGEAIQWTKEPRILPSIPIGKHFGAKWPDVTSGFLMWMLRQTELDADLKWNAQRELQRRGSE